MRLKVRSLNIGLCLFSVLFLLAGCKDEVVALSKPAPSIAVFNNSQEEVTLSQFSKTPVLIDFWSVGCGPCMAMMPELEKLQQQYHGKLVVLGINTDQTDVDLDKYAKKLNVSFPLVQDQLNITKERYNVIGTPTSFLIDSKGTVHAIHEGYLNLNSLQSWIQGVL
ncbi:TlpA family protein disulfide reductase [Vibrio viridaestus]|nr:TlpA disulfide reductase family protein [Vibrio viridaestus]